MSFEAIFNPIFGPLLSLEPIYFVLIMSFLLSVLITVVYKFMTNQTLMKELKDKLKDYQKQMKEHRSDTKKLLELQKSAMDVNMQYMLQSFKPTLVTFIPVILIFGWLSQVIAFQPIIPGQTFTTTLVFTDGVSGNVSVRVPQGVEIIDASVKTITPITNFSFRAKEGDYLLVFSAAQESFEKEVIITTNQKYAPLTTTFRNKPVKSISIGNEKLVVLNLFGWKLGWLGTYILSSIIFSLSLRKLLKLH